MKVSGTISFRQNIEIDRLDSFRLAKLWLFRLLDSDSGLIRKTSDVDRFSYHIHDGKLEKKDSNIPDTVFWVHSPADRNDEEVISILERLERLKPT